MPFCVCVCVHACMHASPTGGGVPLWSSRNLKKRGGVGVTLSASDPTTGSQGGGRRGTKRIEKQTGRLCFLLRLCDTL